MTLKTHKNAKKQIRHFGKKQKIFWLSFKNFGQKQLKKKIPKNGKKNG